MKEAANLSKLHFLHILMDPLVLCPSSKKKKQQNPKVLSLFFINRVTVGLLYFDFSFIGLVCAYAPHLFLNGTTWNSQTKSNKRERRDWEKYKLTVTQSTFPCASWGTICLTNWYRLTGTLDLDGQVIGGLVQRPVYSGWVCLISEVGKESAADRNSHPFCLSHVSICLRPKVELCAVTAVYSL